MGLLSNPMRSRQQRLPLYRKVESPTKERFSHNDEWSTDDESDQSVSGPSTSTSRNVSDSMPRGTIHFAKRSHKGKIPISTRLNKLYPYRLPTKVTRYIFLGIIAAMLLLILSLVRASQVENWKISNGETDKRPPPPPPLWEKFPFLERYYGGIRSVVPIKKVEPQYPRLNEPVPLNPPEAQVEAKKPDDEAESKQNEKRNIPQSKSWQDYPSRAVEENLKECYMDEADTVRVPSLRYYNGRPYGFPQHVVGSFDVLKLPEDICFDRYGRYGPYGFGYSVRSGGLGTGEHGDDEGSSDVWTLTRQVDFRNVDWAGVQRRCYLANAHRFKKSPPKTPTPHGYYASNFETNSDLQTRDVGENNTSELTVNDEATEQRRDQLASDKPSSVKSSENVHEAEKKSRTAVVIRCWDTYVFREDDIANIRSMITELSMASGGRYDIHLLVQVKDDSGHPIWADHKAYEERVKSSIPEEFRGLVTLWTETQMLSLYQGIFDLFSRGPDLPVHGVYRGLSMAMQYFAYMHPEYDYFWQWEADARYTGHYYDLFNKLESWAKEQPRKGLWERNSRWYLPDVHGSWDDFKQMARLRSEMGPIGGDNPWKNMPGAENSPEEVVNKKHKPVWGPVRPADTNDWFESDNDPVPPTSAEEDKYVWGVGEEADLITLNPLFDPDGTTWILKDDITGYNRSHPMPPRRAHMIVASRISRRLALSMHRMTAYKKQFAFPEMWAATAAYQRGLKAVFAPHPVFVDRRWPLDYMEKTYNAGDDGSSGGSRTSVFGVREHNLKGLSWFYNSGFASNLYQRWMGLKVNNDGGEEFEKTEDLSKDGAGVSNMRGGEGRMCLPPMLLHPVKGVELPVEEPPKQEGNEETELDPAA